MKRNPRGIRALAAREALGQEEESEEATPGVAPVGEEGEALPTAPATTEEAKAADAAVVEVEEMATAAATLGKERVMEKINQSPACELDPGLVQGRGRCPRPRTPDRLVSGS